MTESVGLKPCPFCNNPGSILPSSDHSTAYEGGCSNENCPAFDTIWEIDEVSAIAAWNRRPTPSTEAVEAARRLIAIDEGTSGEDEIEYLDAIAVARALLSIAGDQT